MSDPWLSLAFALMGGFLFAALWQIRPVRLFVTAIAVVVLEFLQCFMFAWKRSPTTYKPLTICEHCGHDRWRHVESDGSRWCR